MLLAADCTADSYNRRQSSWRSLPALVSGPNEILARIGAGGMGEVYRGRDSRLGRIVAVKVLGAHLAATPEIRKRFEREARTVSQLSHPNICAIYDVGREGELDYLVMEHLEGETLAERLVRGPMPHPGARSRRRAPGRAPARSPTRT